MSAQLIAALNDTFRQTLLGGKVLLTSGITAFPEKQQQAILAQVQSFSNFTPENDPYGEHDFGGFDYQGIRIFWKIDYYDLNLTHGSEHPEDPNQTVRVLTVMLAEEY